MKSRLHRARAALRHSLRTTPAEAAVPAAVAVRAGGGAGAGGGRAR
ncbi:hypothetical protein ACFZDG_35375 [Kitasatospora xanthocidica]